MRKHRYIAATAVALTLAGGGAAGALLSTPGAASAQTSTAASTSTPSTWMTNTLNTLVSNGTITQAQADAISSAFAAARPAGGAGWHHGGGRGVAVAAQAIGIDSATLQTALTSGQTIAQVAQAHGVDPQTVISALVSAEQTHVAADVASGRLTQAKADQILANANQHATDLVNGTTPAATGAA